jgi:Na+-driven multidrug efflux pump
MIRLLICNDSLRLYDVVPDQHKATAIAMRTGNLIGAGERSTAQHAAWVGIKATAVIMAAVAAVLYTGRRTFSTLFTKDEDVIGLAVDILSVIPLFAFLDGTVCPARASFPTFPQ